MRLFISILFALQLIFFVHADATTTTNTLVWATGTISGKLTTYQSIYRQKFTSMYEEVSSPVSGSMGLGSLSGQVGQIRTYDQTTITATNGASPGRAFLLS
ncbi:killer toxin resistant protein [Yamadazyma tenuis]|uniref:killer toxin resistant protein n=1 Tax=Candida tenuis TaxID=2315449 RepID=UPI00279CC72A|nr:killer toxin resistant protein [Yamadazyma tenuis]